MAHCSRAAMLASQHQRSQRRDWGEAYNRWPWWQRTTTAPRQQLVYYVLFAEPKWIVVLRCLVRARGRQCRDSTEQDTTRLVRPYCRWKWQRPFASNMPHLRVEWCAQMLWRTVVGFVLGEHGLTVDSCFATTRIMDRSDDNRGGCRAFLDRAGLVTWFWGQDDETGCKRRLHTYQGTCVVRGTP